MHTSLRATCGVAIRRLTVVSSLLAAQPGPSAAAPAVQWRELRVPSRAAHAMVWDSRRERALLLGGDSQNGLPYASVWSLVEGARPRWQRLPTLGDGPLRRTGIAAVYDSLRDRVLVFGGRASYGDAGSSDLWELKLGGQPAWNLLDTSGGAVPSARSHASLVFDSQDRLIMYGGEPHSSPPTDSSVWILPLGASPLAWSSVSLPGPGPGPRARHSAVHSPVTNRMTVFGGDRLIVSGGGIKDYVLRPATTWELVLEPPVRWVRRASAPSDSVPLPATGGTLLADRAGEAAWWFPGDGGDFPAAPDASIWRLDLLGSTWTRVQSGAGGPGVLAGAGATLIPSSGEVLLHGGARFFIFGEAGGTSTATWRFDPSDPEPWSVAIPLPPVTTGWPHTSGVRFDAVARRLFTWNVDGVWTLDLAIDGAWQLDPAGAAGAPPITAVRVIDSSRRLLLAFGGQDAARRSIPPTQLWSWPLDGPGAWTSVPIEGRPPLATFGNQAEYDAARDRVIVVPSSSQFDPPPLAALDSVSVLELGGASPVWARLAVSGGPPRARSDASVVIQPARERLFLHGGVNPDLSGTHVRDLWTLSLSGAPAWTNVIPEVPGVTPRFGTRHGLVLDPTLDRLLVLGGSSQSPMDVGSKNLVVATPLDPILDWTDLDPDRASPMYGAGAGIFDIAAERALFWNSTLWEITWPHGPVGVPPDGPIARGLTLGPPRPNPATGSFTLRIGCDVTAEVTLEVFDTAGRRAGRALRQLLTPGYMTVSLSLPRDLAPGLYLVRARQGARTAQVRLAVTR